MSRYDFDIDGNQPEIVAALEAVDGCEVTRLDKCGEGVGDLLVGYRRRWFVLEVKNPATENPAKPEKALTKAQQKWHAKQRRHRAPLFIVFTPAEALAAIGAA